MTDIEKRLKALEKRALVDDERWQMLDAEMKAISVIFHAIGAPLCAKTPGMLKMIIQNISTYEKVSRAQNEHAATIRYLRKMRKFFESRML